MDYVTTVRVLVAGSRKPISGATVVLYDRDEHSEDDRLGIGDTNQFGEVEFKYKTGDFADDLLGQVDDQGFLQVLGRDTVPDLYAVVYDAKDQVVVSTRENATNNKAAGHLNVEIDPEKAAAHNLTIEA